MQYELDATAHAYSHTIGRLLPYHCQNNTAELVWAQAKCEVADRNTILRVSDTEISMNTAIDITKTVWQSCVKHTQNLQDQDFRTK